jgi:hypothetical protein
VRAAQQQRGGNVRRTATRAQQGQRHRHGGRICALSAAQDAQTPRDGKSGNEQNSGRSR